MGKTGMAQVHLVLLVAWVLLLVPTLLWWKDSILWVLVISIYANIASHWSAWEAKRAARYVREQAGAASPDDSAGEEALT
jgi:hypothetical protein